MLASAILKLKDVMAGQVPRKALVVVIGATGTGKSNLAVDLATKFDGEILNGDAMQMYDGLPIITNKISLEEQKGIRHHLLGVVGLNEEPWRVGKFKAEASRIISEIRSRGKLPILVGGTHYYTQSLLFDDALVGDTDIGANGEGSVDVPREDISQKYPILERPTEEVLQQLKDVDPIMADRWHPNDRRKIRRSLEIYLTTGRKASEIYEEQKLCSQERSETDSSTGLEDERAVKPLDTLFFWVHADSEALKARLDSRVETMVDLGLLEEARVLDDFLISQEQEGVSVDITRGIWASIGWKEFEPFLSGSRHSIASSKELEALKNFSIDRTQSATRQYAKRQVRWIRIKLMAALAKAEANDNLYLLDATDLNTWSKNVSELAVQITKSFLSGDTRPIPTDISPSAKELLKPIRSFDLSDRRDLWTRRVCEACGVTAVTEELWEKHINGRAHRRVIKSEKRRDVEAVDISNKSQD